MKRKRGTVIIETEKGILLTKDGEKGYLLPGGQLEKEETPFEAAIRELREETGLTAEFAEILFTYESNNYNHTVVYVRVQGNPVPKAEIKKIAYFGDKTIEIMNSSKEIIAKYFNAIKKD